MWDIDQGVWEAQVTHPKTKKEISLGTFDREYDAAQAVEDFCAQNKLESKNADLLASWESSDKVKFETKHQNHFTEN